MREDEGMMRGELHLIHDIVRGKKLMDVQSIICKKTCNELVLFKSPGGHEECLIVEVEGNGVDVLLLDLDRPPTLVVYADGGLLPSVNRVPSDLNLMSVVTRTGQVMLSQLA
jgi:hypothetical protein